MGRLRELQRRVFGSWPKGEPSGTPANLTQTRGELDQELITTSSRFSSSRTGEGGSCSRTSHSPTSLNTARLLTREEEAIEWLEICAGKVSVIIRGLPKCPHNPQGPRAEEEHHLCATCLSIATKLRAIETSLKVMWLESNHGFHKQVGLLLGILDDMCSEKPYDNHVPPHKAMKDRFPSLWDIMKDERPKEQWVLGYLKRPYDIICILEQTCKAILDFLPNDGSEGDLEEFEPEDHSAAQDALLSALTKHTLCDICVQHDAEDPPLRHESRLFLMKLRRKEDLVRFDVITRSTINESWEDLCIEIPASTGRRVKFANEEGSDHTPHDSTRSTDTPLKAFCKIFQENNACRVSLRLRDNDLFWSKAEVLRHEPSPGLGMSLSDVLSRFRLTVREKFALGHIIALSFWQFYSSELMDRVWNSDTIWFMPQADGLHNPSKVPLKAYVSFHPDKTKRDEDASECIERIGLIHKYPRILSLGILLLEIGLGEPLSCPPTDGQSRRLNKRHSNALVKLQELEHNTTWDVNRQHLLAFVRATANCLNFDGLPHMKEHSSTSISFTRRDWLHQRVVAILADLDKRFPMIDNMTNYLVNKPLRSAITSSSHDPANRCTSPAAVISPEPEHASYNGSKQANSKLSGERNFPTSEKDFKIAIFCALPLEASAVAALFDNSWNGDKLCYCRSKGDDNIYSISSFGLQNIVLVHMGRMGKVQAATAASHCQHTFRSIELAVVVGICGAVPFTPRGDEIVLGDVIVSEDIIQYDFGRQFTEAFESKDAPLDSIPRPKNQIANFLAKLKSNPTGETLQKRMSSYLTILQQISKLKACYPSTNRDLLFSATHEHPDRARTCECAGCCGKELPRKRLVNGTSKPAVYYGLFASGDKVMKSGTQRDALAAKHTGILGFEMEGAGVWSTFPCVVIKGACDYADSHKTKAFQPYAAATAASYAKAFLDEWGHSFSG